MRKNIILTVAVAALAVLAGNIGWAQPYSNAVVGLNPVAYWPLTETTPPPFGAYIATNIGTAGATANGYYETWFQPFATGTNTLYYQTNNIVHVAGAIADGDTAMSCTHAAAGTGQYVVFPRFTNGVANPAVTLVPPFAIEVWVFPTTTTGTVMPIVNEGRNPVIDASTGYTTNSEDGFSLGQFGTIFYFATWNNRGADGTKQEIDTALTVNQWQHLVINFDGTNQTWFKNGVQVGTRAIPASAANAAGQRFTPDLTSPLLIGTGSIIGAGNGASEYGGTIDEVAIYTNTLDPSAIQNHFNASTATDSTYVNTVLADNPAIYLRLNEPAFPSSSYPAASTYPVANNYGVIGAAGKGFYQPGTAPGVAGPPFSGFGASSRAVAINGFSGAVDIGGGSLPAELNPTNNSPVTVSAWFKGNPADAAARFQEIVGHGNASWRIALDNNAGTRFNPGNNPELQFASMADVLTNGFIVNDGKWHFVAGVSDGTTDSLYVDGALAKTGTPVGAIVGSTLDAVLGGDPGFQVPIWNGTVTTQPRYFEGEIAHVAFFTNALSAGQIQNLYNVAGVPPFVLTQPPASVATNAGVNLAIPVVAKGSSPLAYQWYKTNGTAAAAGQTTASLSFNPLATNNAGSYYVVVTNSFGAVTSSTVALTVFGPPIVQQQSLTGVRVFAGTTPTLRVTATGPSLTYQWSRNNLPISGATNSSYLVTNTASVGVSTYNCAITNFVGSNSLSAITVTVLSDPTAPYPVQVLADHPIAYFRLDESDNGTGNNGVTAYDYAGGLNGSYSNTFLGQPGYMPATDSDTAAEFGFPIATSDSYVGDNSTYLTFGGPNGANVQFSVEAWVTSTAFQGSDAGVVTLGYGNGGEQFDLDTGGTTSRNFRFIVRDASGAAHVVNGTVAPNTGGVWHHVVGVCDEVNGHIYLYIDGALNGSAAITAGTGILGLTVPMSIGSRLAGSGSTDYDNQFTGVIDDVALYNYALSPAQIGAHYFAAGVPPVITQIQPFNEEINSGATATFTVTATGTAPLAYQWYDNNSAPISGATTATLTLPNAQQSQSGSYSVTVTNLYGSTSTNASLTVDLGAPQIVTDVQPLERTVYAGVQVTYSVQVSGSAPFSYQWFRDGAPVSGATSSSYSFLALLGTNTYYVAVTNQFSASQNGGPTFSSTATLIGVAATTLNPSDYTYKMKVAFTGYNRNETLSDFPALVQLGTNVPGFAYGQLASPTGGDLRFTDSGGTRVIPHEIDEWIPGGVSPVWVQVPALSGTNDFVWAYWGNPAAITAPASQTNGAVWVPQSFENLPAYDVVYHLKEGALPFADSTEQNPALAGVAPGATNGIVGTAGYFAGSQFLDAGTVTNIDDTFTLSAWININTGTSDIQTTWANQHGGFGSPGFALFVDSYQQADQLIDLATGVGGTPPAGGEARTANGAVSFGAWHLLAAAVDRINATVNFYLDGSPVPLASGNVYPGFTNVADLNLGRFTDGGFYFHGFMDEARIQSGLNSSNWVWASYMTVAQNSTFENYAPIVSSAVTLTAKLIGAKLVLTWPNGTLQSATQVNGQYNDLTGITSPYTNTPSGPQQFYRVKVR